MKRKIFCVVFTLILVFSFLPVLSTGAVYAAGSFNAYNDCDGTAVGNVTGYTVTSGKTTGLLKDFVSGANTPVTVTFSSSGSPSALTGTYGGNEPDSGTDAYTTFHDYVSMSGGTRYGNSSGWYIDMTFTGLDPAKTYTFATSGNRGDSDYTDRIAKFTVSDVDGATNASTSGVTVNNELSVSFSTGYNSVTGYVARWTGIQPGTDGDFKVRVEPESGEYRAYGPSVFQLMEEDVTVIPPSAPEGLNATAVSYEQIDLIWTDMSNDESGFKIERKTGSGGAYEQIAVTSADTEAYNDTGLDPGIEYFYRVRAYKDDLDSAYSNEDSATTFANNAPFAPELVSPLNGSTDIDTSPTLEIIASDPDADFMDVTFYGGEAGAGAGGGDFTIVVLPDTQMYAQSYPAIFTGQTQWIADNLDDENIVFVTHVGDIVNTASSATQWQNADAAFDILDAAGVPYSVGPGNHDAGTNYSTYFGTPRFTGKSWYGGSNDANNYNNYSLFSASGMDFIIINLQYNAASGALDWADGLLKANPGRQGIIVQHDMLNVNDTWVNQNTFNALKDNPNMFLMLCGHMHTPTDGAAYREETGDDSHTIHVLQQDYQDFTSGGNGYMRILRFSPSDDKIYATTYSFYIDANITTYPDQMEMNYVMPDSAVFTAIGTVSGVANGANVYVPWAGRELDTEYQWYVEIADPYHTTTGPVWSFTTMEELPPEEYELSVSVTGSGSVNLDPDLSVYEEDTPVQLTAIPADGWSFTGWSGDLGGNNNPETLIMDSNKSVTAAFEMITYTITATAGANGSITPSGAVTVNHGDSQAFNITASGGYQIADVLVDSVSAGQVSSYTFENVTAGHTISATFAETGATTYQLTVTASPPGSGTVTGAGSYEAGETVTITAAALTGYQFYNWTSPAGSFGDASMAETTFTMPAQDVTVTANFSPVTPVEYTLTTSTVGSGTVQRDPDSSSYEIGSEVTLTAVPETGWVFLKWTGDLSGDVNPQTITMNDHKEVTATFIPDTSVHAVRVLPAAVYEDTEFEVIISFTALENDFNSIGVTDIAPDEWPVSVNTAWCTPGATANMTHTDSSVEYVWLDTYPSGTSFTAVYKVTVPAGTLPGSYIFPDGELEYYVGENGPFTIPIGGDNEIIFGGVLTGRVYEVKGVPLPGATVESYLGGVLKGSATTGPDGYYELLITEPGDYTVAAGADNFFNETRDISIPALGGGYTLDFTGNHGLIPLCPDMSYVLACANKWLYPPADRPELALSMSKVLAVVNAWLSV